MDYISKETAKFDSNKEAYKFLLEILNGFEEAKKDVFKKYYGIWEKKHTLFTISINVSSFTYVFSSNIISCL